MPLPRYRVIGTSRSGRIADFSHPHLAVAPPDVTDDASIAQAVAQIGQLVPALDLLANSAGVGADLGTAAPARQLLRGAFATNVDGTVLFTEPLLPLVRDGGQIVFLSSKMVLPACLPACLPAFAAPDGPAYCISKAAVNLYAAILAQRVAARHIVVTPKHDRPENDFRSAAAFARAVSGN